MALHRRTGRDPDQLLPAFLLAVAGAILLLLPIPRSAQGNEPQSPASSAEASQPEVHKLPAQCADIGFPANNLWLDYYDFDGLYPEGWPEGFSLPEDSLLSRQPHISHLGPKDGPFTLQTDGFTFESWPSLVQRIEAYFEPQDWCRTLSIVTPAGRTAAFNLPGNLNEATSLTFTYRPYNACVYTQIDYIYILLERSENPECSCCYFLVKIDLRASSDAAPPC